MFDINVEQHYLAKALEYLKPTVGKNAGGLGDNCISMRTTGNGSIVMFTTNTIEFTELELVISSSNGAGPDQAPLVDFKRFEGIISTIPANEIVSIKASVNDILISFGLKAKPIKLVGCLNGIVPLPTNAFPSTGVNIPKQTIKDALDYVCAIVEDNDASPIYNCMRILTDKNSVEVSALDITNKRTMTFTNTVAATCNNPQQTILIEASKLKKSLKLFEDFLEMEFIMDATMIRVRAIDPIPGPTSTNGMITDIKYYCRRLSGAFPANIKQNFHPQPKEYVIVDKQDLMNCFMRAKAIEDKTNGGIVKIEASGSKMVVSMNSTHGNMEDDIDTVNQLTSSFCSMFKYPNIIDILKVISGQNIEIGVLPSHPSNYVVKESGNTNTFMFTVSTMNMQNGTP